METDDSFVMLSAISHYSYCPRRCALVHVEREFEENVFTLKGNAGHERADTPTSTENEEGRIERALPLWSNVYGIHGKGDTVEFRHDGSIYPVEYKHGGRRENLHDDLQLCGQALCLEEMFGQEVPKGAIFHILTKRRREVEFTKVLRATLKEVISQIRELLYSAVMPVAVNDARCRNCSLLEVCSPEPLSAAKLNWHGRNLYRLEEI